jgi:hypothetical protein
MIEILYNTGIGRRGFPARGKTETATPHEVFHVRGYRYSEGEAESCTVYYTVLRSHVLMPSETEIPPVKRRVFLWGDNPEISPQRHREHRGENWEIGVGKLHIENFWNFLDFFGNITSNSWRLCFL